MVCLEASRCPSQHCANEIFDCRTIPAVFFLKYDGGLLVFFGVRSIPTATADCKLSRAIFTDPHELQLIGRTTTFTGPIEALLGLRYLS